MIEMHELQLRLSFEVQCPFYYICLICLLTSYMLVYMWSVCHCCMTKIVGGIYINLYSIKAYIGHNH